jgi:hypothetical protein
VASCALALTSIGKTASEKASNATAARTGRDASKGAGIRRFLPALLVIRD